jgi:hypothetical protein
MIKLSKFFFITAIDKFNNGGNARVRSFKRLDPTEIVSNPFPFIQDGKIQFFKDLKHRIIAALATKYNWLMANA